MMGTIAPSTAAPLTAAGQKSMSASFANSFRIAAVADRLASHLKSDKSISNSTEFFALCLSLARGIDYAVANNEIPTKVKDLPELLKQVCWRKNDHFLQAAIMVLMISVKNACKIGWFLSQDSKELLDIADEIGSSFCCRGDNAPSDSPSIISTVCSRFYPLMKMGNVLASLEVKPGYGAYVVDFHISKNTMHSPQDKIRLFVAERDNIETSACIISPQQVNFLLNGKGVERRTNVSMDPGPQTPTIVTPMLKYGTNLLQVVGQFKGHYIIAVAFMSVGPIPETPELPDYVQSSVATEDPDSDVIEGPSRVSLNCPISYTRIQIPIKGESCKHLQCFDFSNFISINSRRPSWRCPHCNQNVSYPKIRIDQNMAKVLKEVGETIADVIIAADGSWKAVLDTEENENKAQKVVDCPNDVPKQQETGSIVDLTVDSDWMDVDTSIDEDRKPSQATLQSNLPNVASAVNQSAASPSGNRFWSNVFDFASQPGSTGSAQQLNQMFGPYPANSLTSPVITDAISSALGRDVGGYMINNPTSSAENQIQLMNAAAYAAASNQFARSSHIARNFSRTPIAVQGLPAAPRTPLQTQRPGPNLNTSLPSGSSFSSHASVPRTPVGTGVNMTSNQTNRHHPVSRPHINPHQVPSSLQQPSLVQHRNHQDQHFNAGQSVQHAAGVRNEPQNLQQHQSLRMPQSRIYSPTIGRPSSGLPPVWSQTQPGASTTTGFSNSQHPRFSATTQRPVQMARQPPSTPVQIPTSRGPSNTDTTRTPAITVPRVNVGELQVNSRTGSEENWQPSGRMRGSLSGHAVNAYKEFIIQPTQPSQTQTQQTTVTPPPPPPPPPVNVPPALEAFLSNSRNFFTQTQNTAMTQPANTSGNSGTLP